ncbi:hypothetical protein ABID22_001834 [Pontibacter aydingkolensis]|uniref:Uncharacterized protein n=1 Tax=Pontibacter aydingkolensis TaxID=1911536 RepID=A0ABS7CPK5_9BACT|nr:DUF6624 domain-containing protein [Pontibacter aydingkolensis]MBW7465782.1 hypothetical protein [Pontibacter aydingkolensis]
MKRTALLFLLACLSLTAVAQTTTDAFAKYEAKEYKASGEMYDKSLKAGKGTASDHYNAACSWALAGNKEKAFAHLEQTVAKGYTSIGHMQQDSDLSSLHSDKRWAKLVEDLKRNLATIEAKYNQPLKTQLEKIYETDQQVRREFMAAMQQKGAESAEVKELGQKMEQIDTENQKKVVAIIEEHGWPGKSMVGSKAQMAAFLVIQHAPLVVQEKYLPLLRKATEDGELEKRHLAMLEDRVLVGNNQPQKYGSQLRLNPDTQKYEFYPIDDEVNVDKRRAEMGMEPLGEYARRQNIEYVFPKE